MVRSKNPPSTVGQYLILEELGAGSFARVYRCEHMISHKKFAGKLYDVDFAISEEGCRLLRKEISIMKLLRHPNVIRFQEVVSNRKCMLIVMELVEGRTLLNVMPPSGGLPESFARPVMKQILDAVVFLHCNGIVHRDIKLENVMIQNDGSIKIIDFGLAEHVPEEFAREGLLIDGRCGSPHYYSPEMILARDGNRFHGDKVDIWAIGILLYALVTGFHPFFAEDDDKDSLYIQILNDEVPFENDMSRTLEHLLRKSLVKNPSKRATLGDIRNHPWTNDTFLTPDAVNAVLSRGPEIAPCIQAPTFLSNQNDYLAIRNALTPATVVPSNNCDEKKGKGSCDVDKNKSHDGEEESPLTKSQGKSGAMVEFKLWERMKEGFKVLFNHSKKRTPSKEGFMSISEKMNSSMLAVDGDIDLTSARNGIFSDSFSSKHSFRKAKSHRGKDDRTHSGKICKITFACWMNV